MARDKSQRLTLVHVDDDCHRSAVVVARRLIYEKNHRVDAAAIEGLLKEYSLVPITVCLLVIILKCIVCLI
jgi:hypothetical protein